MHDFENRKRASALLVNINDCYNSLEQLFSNKMKFEVANDDLTLCNLSAVQNYLNFLFYRG